MRARTTSIFFPVALCALLSLPALAVEPMGMPYVYQRDGDGAALSVTLSHETGYGTRESRNFAPHGLEQALRARFQPWSFLGAEVLGGVVVDSDGEYGGELVGVEVIGRLLNQAAHSLDLDLGLGYVWDYRDDHIPRVRLTLGRSFGRFHIGGSGLLEVPVGSAGRDEADVMVSLAASYAVAPFYRQGFELAGEDLEGLFEDEESEGGAKLLFGPTAAFDIAQAVQLKLNLAAVYAHLSNQKNLPARDLPDEWGFMGRLVLGYTFQ